MAFTTYGLRIGVRTNTPAILDRLPAVLPPGWRREDAPEVDRLYSLVVGGAGPRPSVRRYHILYADAGRLARSMDLDDVFARLEDDLRIYVADRARRRLFVHAGVVRWRSRAIVIPGASLSGKSCLVAALVRAGATETAERDSHAAECRSLSDRLEGRPRRGRSDA